MIGLNKHKQAGSSIFLSSMKGVSNIVAVVVTLLATGPAYQASKGWVFDFASQHYGVGMADMMTTAWSVVCALLIFFLARASISTAIMFGAVTVMTRFL